MTKPVVGWFEVTGKDGPALQKFYAQLFGWTVNDAGDGSGYGLVEAGEKGIAWRDRDQPGRRVRRCHVLRRGRRPCGIPEKRREAGRHDRGSANGDSELRPDLRVLR